MDQLLPLRIMLVGVPLGVSFAMQCGKSELISPAHQDDDSLCFEFSIRVSVQSGDGRPNFLGPLAHGTPADRFLYVNSGTSAGQRGSAWTRRAKIKLGGITWDQIRETLGRPGSVIVAQIAGTARDGGPCCATVPLLGEGWQVRVNS